MLYVGKGAEIPLLLTHPSFPATSRGVQVSGTKRGPKSPKFPPKIGLLRWIFHPHLPDTCTPLCSIITEQYAGTLYEVCNGIVSLYSIIAQTKSNVDPEKEAEEFASFQIKEMCAKVLKIVGENLTGMSVVRSCIHSIRDEFQDLHRLFPRMTEEAFAGLFKDSAFAAAKKLL